MRTGITVEVSATERQRLAAIVADRNSPQKHGWRAEIMLLTAAVHFRRRSTRAMISTSAKVTSCRSVRRSLQGYKSRRFLPGFLHAADRALTVQRLSGRTGP
jgi:hypothetical protein